MRRRAKVAAALLLGLLVLWLALYAFDLFLVATVIGLIIRLGFVLEQRDQTTVELADAWFTIAALEYELGHLKRDAS